VKQRGIRPGSFAPETFLNGPRRKGFNRKAENPDGVKRLQGKAVKTR
jgi:hypothetical protein